MNLAEAIRYGAADTNPLRHFLFKARYGDIGSTCALGAAAYANGLPMIGKTDIDIGIGLREVYPELYQVFTACPDCGNKVTLEMAIFHLNDRHFWTREAIADWLDAMTLDLTPVTVEAAVCSS